MPKRTGTCTLPVSSIVVSRRHRKHLGDIDGLAASIEELGLLQPVAVNPDRQLIAGARRLVAVKLLGWRAIPVHIVDGLDDALLALRAERDENVCRLDFKPSEAVALGRTLERLERPEARKRQQEGGRAGGKASGKLPEASAGRAGDKVAGSVGLSRRSYEKARAVVEAAAAEPRKYRRLLEDMDRGGKVDGIYRRLQVLKQAEAIDAEPPPLPGGKYRVLVVDPPWTFGRQGDPSHRSASPYPQMDLDEIQALPVAQLAARDAILFLWATNAHLPDAFTVLAAWGFKYVTCLTWIKNRIGTGDWLRGRSEHALMGIRGRPIVTLAAQSTVLSAPAREHSRKPEEFYALVESLCPGSKLELFARSKRAGWTAHGDEVNGDEPRTRRSRRE